MTATDVKFLSTELGSDSERQLQHTADTCKKKKVDRRESNWGTGEGVSLD